MWKYVERTDAKSHYDIDIFCGCLCSFRKISFGCRHPVVLESYIVYGYANPNLCNALHYNPSYLLDIAFVVNSILIDGADNMRIEDER